MIRLLTPEERETYFTSTERGRIVHEVLAHTAYGERSKGEVGIDRLVKEGVFTAAYPLHEVSSAIMTHVTLISLSNESLRNALTFRIAFYDMSFCSKSISKTLD